MSRARTNGPCSDDTVFAIVDARVTIDRGPGHDTVIIGRKHPKTRGCERIISRYTGHESATSVAADGGRDHVQMGRATHGQPAAGHRVIPARRPEDTHELGFDRGEERLGEGRPDLRVRLYP
jgi:hypothetical protein